MRFMARASDSWASFEMEPKLIAPVAKRFTISASGSTRSRSTGGPVGWNRRRPRSVALRVFSSLA